MMKTIFVVYGPSQSPYQKRYVYNTPEDVSLGDEFQSDSRSNVVVVEILDEYYEYFNMGTGELKNHITSTQDFPIKTLREKEDGQVYMKRQKCNFSDLPF